MSIALTITIDADWLKASGYYEPRQLPDGEWIALIPLLYTTGLVAGLDEFGWTKRWCYKTPEEAIIALHLWDGKGDPPGNWIASRGRL